MAVDRGVAATWPHLAALADMLDELDGRRVQINHTINHVDRRETVTSSPRDPLAKARKHREKQSTAGL